LHAVRLPFRGFTPRFNSAASPVVLVWSAAAVPRPPVNLTRLRGVFYSMFISYCVDIILSAPFPNACDPCFPGFSALVGAMWTHYFSSG
jgi:hypothetical protein